MEMKYTCTPVNMREIIVPGFKNVILFDDQASHVEGIVAIHDTTLGSALGGCRIQFYDKFLLGFDDALSLARAMTYKSAIMSLPFGGGKTVLFQKPGIQKITYFKALAQVLNKIAGEYVTTDDMGCSASDMDDLRELTPYARGQLYKGKQIPATSFGVYQAIKAVFINLASSIRVAFYSGGGNIQGVQKVVQINFCLGLMIALIISILFYFVTNKLLYLFTNTHDYHHAQVLPLARNFFHIAAIFVFFDAYKS